MRHVTIATDGACKSNPGIGGWGAILIFDDDLKEEISGGELLTTNNKMELLAAINALKFLNKFNCKFLVKFIVDSMYLKNGITLWVKNWERNGWKTSSGGSVKNVELWKELIDLSKLHEIEWIWQKSHVGNELNERADELANIGISKIKV